jgi:4-amino-4-deoxy-L-arabinose transferase-like glycosyltransferase
MGETTDSSKVSSGPAARGDVGERGWASFLGLVCLVILFANLGGAALFDPDEGRNAEKAREILLLNDWVTPHHNFLPTLDKPMFFYWPVAFSFKLFGFTEGAARLPSALAGLGCVILVYLFAHRQWGLREALWSSLILVTSLGFFVFARVVIFDMSLTFFLTLALVSFYAAAHAQAPRSGLLHSTVMYAALGAGTLIKGAVAIVVPGMVIFSYLLLTRQWFISSRLRPDRGVLIYCAIVIPWYLWSEAKNPGYLSYFLWEEHFARYLTAEFERSRVWYYFIVVVAAGFFPWSMLLPLTIADIWRKKYQDPCRFLALWALLPFIFFSLSKSQLPQYILPIFPALALVTGRFLAERLSSASGLRFILIPWVVVVGVVLYLFVGAAWPNLSVRYLRTAVAQNLLSLTACGVLLVVILGIFLRGYRGNIWRGWGAVYLFTAAGLALFFVVLGQLTATVSRERSSRPLAQASAPFISPGDRVAFYDTYLPGMAFYLGADKPLWIAQNEEKDKIMGSNYLGMRRPAAAAGHGQVVFSFSEFAAQWKRTDLVLRVFVKEKNLQRLSADVGGAPRSLMKYDEYLLVTNR